MTGARSRLALVVVAAASLAGCAGLIGFEPLSGSDAGPDASATTTDAGADADVGVPGPADATTLPEASCVIAWVDASGGQVPPGAVPNEAVGDSGIAIYICRVSSPTLGLVPGKLLPSWACYYGDGVSEQLSQDYQVLVPTGCPVDWAYAPYGIAPADALVCGQDLEGGIFYSCRVTDAGAMPGELGHMGWSTNHQCVYSYGGQSLTTGTFDVLTVPSP